MTMIHMSQRTKVHPRLPKKSRGTRRCMVIWSGKTWGEVMPRVSKAGSECNGIENHVWDGVLNVETESAFRYNGRFFANSPSCGSSPC